jgi:hypothetical protein
MGASMIIDPITHEKLLIFRLLSHLNSLTEIGANVEFGVHSVRYLASVELFILILI